MSKIKQVAIIGSGSQGSMIAFRCAIYGKDVYIYDIAKNALDRCREKIDNWLLEQVEKEKITQDTAKDAKKRIHLSVSLPECCKNADLVIESVPETLELKQRMWQEIDALAPEKTIICTNSSSIMASRINGQVKRKDRTFNLNFSFPIDDDLCEVMWNAHTSEETKKAVKEFLKSMNNVYLITEKEIQGFSFNRLWRAIKKESLYLWGNDISSAETIDRAWMIEFGTTIGPFGLMDKVGLDVVRDIEMSYYRESGDERDIPPKKLFDMIAAGKLGEKTGQGFYKYPNPDYQKKGWLTISYRKKEEEGNE